MLCIIIFTRESVKDGWPCSCLHLLHNAYKTCHSIYSVYSSTYLIHLLTISRLLLLYVFPILSNCVSIFVSNYVADLRRFCGPDFEE